MGWKDLEEGILEEFTVAASMWRPDELGHEISRRARRNEAELLRRAEMSTQDRNAMKAHQRRYAHSRYHELRPDARYNCGKLIIEGPCERIVWLDVYVQKGKRI